MGLDIRILNLNKKGVSLTDKYTDTLWFPTATAQASYFEECQIVAIGNSDKYLDPAMKSIVVDYTVSGILPANYIMFRNSTHSPKWFYAFVDNVVYETMTSARINFTIDIIQTYMFNVEFKPCMVEREHSITDVIGSNIVPENLELGDYIDYETNNVIGDAPPWIPGYGDLKNLVTVIFCSGDYRNNRADATLVGNYAGYYCNSIQGVYNSLGMYFSLKGVGGAGDIHYISHQDSVRWLTNPSFDDVKWSDNVNERSDTVTPLLEMINDIENGINKSEIVAIVAIPLAILKSIVNDGNNKIRCNSISYSVNNLLTEIQNGNYGFDGYKPKNNKLYTHPFNMLYLTNNQGGYSEYKYEYFKDNVIEFTITPTLSINTSCTIIPENYKGVYNQSEEILTLTNYPQCAYINDIFKGWLVNNAGSLLTTAGTLALTVATGGAAAPLLASSALNTMGSLMNTATQPDQAKNVSSGSTQKAIGRLNFTFIRKTISRSYAERIDLFFSKYGYATKKVKIPNISGRSAFNYVKTVDCLISGSCPSDVLKQLETIHNNGITYWKQGATFGVVTQDNV